MIWFIGTVVAAGGAALVWLTSSEKDAKAQEICTGCVQAATDNRLEDIVKYVPEPCALCVDAVEQFSSWPINKLTTIGNLSAVDTTAENGAKQYNCYHRNDPMQVYRSAEPIDCRQLFGGAGISPPDARAEADRLRVAREVIRMKANRSPLSGILSEI